MHPYLIGQLTAAHRADLRRSAVATCCASLVRRFGPLLRRAAPTCCTA